MTATDLSAVRVAVLRTGDAPDDLATALRAHGAIATTLVVADVEDRTDDEVALGVGDLARFAWVALTSANAARRLAPWRAAWPPTTHIGAVGPATRDAVLALGLPCDVTAAGGTASDLAGRIDHGPVLFLAASTARSDLVDELAGREVEVTTVVAYDVSPRRLEPRDVEVLTSNDVVVATSGLAVDAMARVATSVPALYKLRMVALGPTTQRHAASCGWPGAIAAEAREPEAVCDAVRVALER